MWSLPSRLIGAIAGIVLLGLMVLFAVGLPHWQDDPAEQPDSGNAASAVAAPTGDIELPDSLPGGYVALDSDDLPAAVAQQLADPEAVVAGLKQATDSVSEIFGAGAAVRIYASPDASSLVNVTVLDKAPGLFVPDGPPAASGAANQSSYDLAMVGDAVCAEYFNSPTDAQGQPTAGAPQLARVHCQSGAGGRTFDVDTQGVDLAGVKAINEALADL